MLERFSLEKDGGEIKVYIRDSSGTVVLTESEAKELYRWLWNVLEQDESGD